MNVQFEPFRGSSPGFFVKRWARVFLKTRRPLEGSYVEEKREVIESDVREQNVWTDDVISLFMEDCGDAVPSPKVNQVIEFCRGAQMCDIDKNLYGIKKSAWLDDTCEQSEDKSGNDFPSSSRPEQGQQSSGSTSYRVSRTCEGSLTASKLHGHLKQKRFRHETLPDADRRLIFISDLNPFYILALAATVQGHQVASLRDALYKYLALQTSLRVTVLTEGWTVFHLEFHIPYYALRSCPHKPTSQTPIKNKPDRGWTDLSFLVNNESSVTEDCATGIHEAQISLVICGTDEKRWIAYGFADTDFDDDGEMADDDEDGEMEDENSSYDDVFVADQIAENGGVDANHPIWNPREYFLRIVQIRMEQVLKEWTYLVRNIQISFKTYTDTHPFILNLAKSGHVENEIILETYGWTNRFLQVLRKLLERLTKTTTVWQRFSAQDGDIAYVFDVDSSTTTSADHMHSSLLDIKRKFEDLADLGEDLRFLVDECQTAKDSAYFLQLRLTNESKQAAQKNGSTAERQLEFTIESSRAAQRNAELQLESNKTAQRNAELQLQFTLENKRATQRNLSAAELTMLAISPLAAVSSLFQTSEHVVPIPRNLKSFIITLVIMQIALQVLLMLWRCHFCQDEWWEKLKVRTQNSWICAAVPRIWNPNRFRRTRTRTPARSNTMDTLIGTPMNELARWD